MGDFQRQILDFGRNMLDEKEIFQQAKISAGESKF